MTLRILGKFLRRAVPSMRPVLWGLLVFVLCLPLAFVLSLVAAARYPSMDAFTMKLPIDFRTGCEALGRFSRICICI